MDTTLVTALAGWTGMDACTFCRTAKLRLKPQKLRPAQRSFEQWAATSRDAGWIWASIRGTLQRASRSTTGQSATGRTIRRCQQSGISRASWSSLDTTPSPLRSASEKGLRQHGDRSVCLGSGWQSALVWMRRHWRGGKRGCHSHRSRGWCS